MLEVVVIKEKLDLPPKIKIMYNDNDSSKSIKSSFKFTSHPLKMVWNSETQPIKLPESRKIFQLLYFSDLYK